MTGSENSRVSNTDDVEFIKKYVTKEDLMTTIVTLSFFESYFRANHDIWSNFFICYMNVRKYLFRFAKRFYK